LKKGKRIPDTFIPSLERREESNRLIASRTVEGIGLREIRR